MVRATVLGALLVIALTYPTIPRATSVGRLDSNDGRFSIWNIAWIDHALLTDPRHLLDANIFWPHTGTLAYSELNLVAGLFGLPWYAATGSALAALNGSVFVALVLAFVCMAVLVRRLTGSEAAGLASAVAFTFSPFVGARTGHIQLLMIFAFPLLFIAYHRLTERPSPARGVALGAALATAALACGYYGIFGGLALGLVGLILAERSRSYWLALVTAMATTVALISPVYYAFERARQASGAAELVRTADEAREWSANWSSYLASSAIAHEWWLPFLGEWKSWTDVLFPGIGLLVLSGIGMRAMTQSAPQRSLLWAYLALACAAFWASFGPDAGLYTVLNAAVPGMSLLRAPARFGILVTFALCVIAGFGVAHLGRRWRWLPLALVAVLTIELSMKTEQWGWPSWPLRNEPPVSAAYRKLAELPPGVLVEYQFPYEYSNFHNHATAMYLSTYHWKPLVNGYSDLIPPDFREIALPINYFPDPASFEIMKARQVRYVLWHIDYYDASGQSVITRRLERYAEYVRPILKTDDVWLYEIVKWPA